MDLGQAFVSASSAPPGGQRQAWFTPFDRDDINNNAPLPETANPGNGGMSAMQAALGMAAPDPMASFYDTMHGGSDRAKREAERDGLSTTAPLTGAFQAAASMQQPGPQPPSMTPEQQYFLNKLNSDPEMATELVNSVKDIAAARDLGTPETLDATKKLNDNVDPDKLGEKIQANYCAAADGQAGIEKLENMVRANAEEQKNANAAPDPTKPPAAVPSPDQHMFTLTASAAAPSPEQSVQIAAHGSGTHGVQGASAFADEPGQGGLTGANAAAPQPSQTAAAAPPPLFLHGPGLEEMAGRVAITHDGDVEIDGVGTKQLRKEMDATFKAHEKPALALDTAAQNGVAVSIGEAGAMLRTGQLSLDQVDANPSGNAATIRQFKPGRAPGMGA